LQCSDVKPIEACSKLNDVGLSWITLVYHKRKCVAAVVSI